MKLIFGTFVTLDGVMQAPGRFGGGPEWRIRPRRLDVVPYFDETMGRIMTEWIARAVGLLLGRKTYEILRLTGRT